MIMLKPILLSALTLLLALAGATRSGETETVPVGVCLSLSGDFGPQGQTYLAGVRIRVEDFNSRAATTGVRIELFARDDRSHPAIATRMAEELAEKHNVVAIIGSASTDITMAIRPVAQKHGIPVISPSATSPELGRNRDGVFRILFDDRFQGAALAKFMRQKVGLRNAAVITNQRYDYSRSISRAFLRSFVAEEGAITVHEIYDLKTTSADGFDFAPVLRRVKDTSPDIVLLPGYADEAAAIMRQSMQLDFAPVFCGGDSWQHDVILLASGHNINGAYCIGSLDEHSGTPEMKRFIELLDTSNEISAEPSSVLGYDALDLLIHAMENGRTREKIMEGLYAVRDFPLASGRITISPDAGTQKPAYIVHIVEQNGAFVREVVDMVNP